MVPDSCKALQLITPEHPIQVFRATEFGVNLLYLDSSSDTATQIPLSPDKRLLDVSQFVDPRCNCLKHLVVELDVDVPRLSYQVGRNLTVFDSNDKVALLLRVPAQTQFVDQAHTQTNRLRIEVESFTPPSPVDWKKLKYFTATHNGAADAVDVAPADRGSLVWVFRSMIFRHKCKGMRESNELKILLNGIAQNVDLVCLGLKWSTR